MMEHDSRPHECFMTFSFGRGGHWIGIKTFPSLLRMPLTGGPSLAYAWWPVQGLAECMARRPGGWLSKGVRSPAGIPGGRVGDNRPWTIKKSSQAAVAQEGMTLAFDPETVLRGKQDSDLPRVHIAPLVRRCWSIGGHASNDHPPRRSQVKVRSPHRMAGAPLSEG